ncbi:sigma-70 family RNA polymerase sigma factor [Bacteroides fragilis]|uniref:sigma-70 family RNA polymerase sigma factor n=1 Tax=Bacteroides fragilis TaxID=817 RepID=UPI001D08F557|nr:sigma-70 family RNA polymerase sigma factor [Bacteroides fragilis]MCB6710438.1 sigma-70 family RNA polymerase sigma factor [Bacteroides fragilis]MCQ5038111.1 sigma-70 family RNA polymerase sigma factor [Bacteroides fragilis]MCQ5051491.1 sigma-70 family RNA polymerase sigma factor [Bacteroides fragilis]
MKSNVLRFDYWFSFNYKRLRSILGWQLNEDVFHDTYLLLRKDLLFIDLPIIDFEPLFWGIYKRARLRNIAKENRYYRPNEIFFQLISMEEGLSVEELVEPDKLAKDILSFIKHKYPKNDYRLFKLKVYDTGCSYKDLSDYTGFQ